MKRLLFVSSVAMLLSLGLVGVALADNGPHGGYTDLTDKCAGCHRAHTALGASLLAGAASETDKSAFCYTCHGGGLGAYTDVQNGVFVNVNPAPPDELTNLSYNTPLKGGGFQQVKMNAALTGTETLPTTSKHEITGGSNTVWGYGAITSTVDLGTANVALTCTNCHNPHGRAGTGDTATYRILKGNSATNTELFSNGVVTKTASVDIPDEGGNMTYYIQTPKTWNSHSYSNAYFAQHVDGGGDNSQYAAMTNWCAQCHQRYAVEITNNPHKTDSGDAVFKYRHGTNLNSTTGCDSCHPGGAVYANPVTPGCINCHVAHGTGARMGTYSGSVAWPGGAASPNGDARSSLLRLDKRGVCEACHLK
ncbi:MAG: hypothetical protein M1358_20940 [Chloroflexi bacterium]|nr:hypothetical protein [Chloroflexota bacterium]